MPFYLVPASGTGTRDDPFRPDLPAGTPFVGQRVGAEYLVLTPAPIAGLSELPHGANLEAAAARRGLTYSDLLDIWQIRG
jgi:hypothetical protein